MNNTKDEIIEETDEEFRARIYRERNKKMTPEEKAQFEERIRKRFEKYDKAFKRLMLGKDNY